MNRTTPSHAQLGQLLHQMFVDIRNLSSAPGNEELICRIADVAEIIPLQLINPDAEWMKAIVTCLEDLVTSYPNALRYLSALDAADADLKEQLVPTHGQDWANPTPEIAHAQ